MKIGYLMQEGAASIRKNPFSGPSTHVRQVILELKNLGHEVRLIAKLDGGIWRSDNLVDFERVETPWLDRGPLRWLERGIRRIQAQFQLPYCTFFESLRFAAACCQELVGYDLLYERMGWMGYGGSLAARWLKLPLFLETNGDHLSEMDMLGVGPRGLQRWISLRLMHFGVRQATHTVAAGEGWRQRFIERWQVAPERVTTVDNGCELVDLLDRSHLRAFRPPDDHRCPTTLVYVGGFQPWQGVSNLLQAFAGVVAQGVEARLVLIGAGVHLEEMKQLAHDLQIGPLVTFTHRLPPRQYAPYLADADIGLAPYCGWSEFFGLKLLDYKAAGLATIASGMDGQPAVLTHGHTGWIVPPCDIDALCAAIIRLSTDPALRMRMGRAARIEAEKNHSWRHTAQTLQELFLRVASDKSALCLVLIPHCLFFWSDWLSTLCSGLS